MKRSLLVAAFLIACLSTHLQAQTINRYAGNGVAGYTGDGGPATAARVSDPECMVSDAAGNIYTYDNGRIRWVNTGDTIRTLCGAGGTGYVDGPASVAKFGLCNYMAIYDTSLYVSDGPNNVIRKINIPSGSVSTIAGIYHGSGYTGDGGAATAAQIGNPMGIAVDASGSVYFGDVTHGVIRKVTGGIISTFAGTGSPGDTGDGGPATAAKVRGFNGMHFNAAGDLYFDQSADNVVRKISGGIITTFVPAGVLYTANDLIIDPGGDLFIAEYGNYRISKVTPTGTVSTVAGVGIPGFSGDGGPALSALMYPDYLAQDCGGHLFIADDDGDEIRVVNENHAPFFTGGSVRAFTVCSGATYILNSLLEVSDPDIGQTETWTVTTSPGHGALSGFPTSGTVTGTGTVFPSGVSYTAATSYSGADLFVIKVTDCGGATAFVTVNVTVAGTLSAIAGGATTICTGSTITLTDATGGGSWASSDTGIAKVGSGSGVVTGISAGTAVITYTAACGYVTTTVTVSAPPSSITVPGPVCLGQTITLTDATTGGVWTSSNTGVATIGSLSGLVTGMALGVDTITYRLFAGCYATATISVNSTPAAITGRAIFCAGSADTLSDATAGGSWTSSDTTIATVGSGSGILSGVSAGTAVISYTLGTGCAATITVSVVADGPISGMLGVCVGSTITLTDPGGGTWSSGATGIATIGSLSGVVTGVATGTAPVTYTLPSLGCLATATVTVNPLPAAISGPSNVCVGHNITLTNTTGGGTWSSSSPAAAVGSATGIVTGVSAGTVNITYRLGTGCYTTKNITVNPLPSAITGLPHVCIGLTLTLSDATGGGTWSSANTAIATVGSSSGLVSGVALGATTITYTSSYGCVTTLPFTVTSFPGSITGTKAFCEYSTTALADTPAGGVWSSSNPIAFPVGSVSGIVTGLSTGTATITYSLGVGCTATTTVTVEPLPLAIIPSVSTHLCAGASETLTDSTSGGTWSSSDTTIATVSSTGLVTGIAGGTVYILYTLPTGCFVSIGITVITVPPITGAHNMCAFSDSLTVHDAAVSGLYTSTGVTVTNLGGGIGKVHAVAAGVDTIIYTLTSGCATSVVLTVNPLPGIITGILHVCSGATTTLTDATGGGIWSSSPTTIATVGSSSGIVTGVSTGTAVITYTLPTGCFADTSVVVNPAPTAIGGDGFICIGSTRTLTDGTPGGTWSSSNTSIATVGSTSGVVTGVADGTATISYTVCSSTVTVVVTVSAIAPIAGANTVCRSATMTLTDATGGGVWSSSNTSVATVGSSSGIVTPVATGTVTMTYTLATGCSVTFPIFVDTNTSSCAPCSVFSSYSRIGPSGSITSNLSPGNYYIANNVTISNNDTFTNAIILVAPGDTVIVDTSYILTLDSSHLFSLCNLWAGIKLKPGHTHSARLSLTNNTLVEDAQCAVFIPNASMPSSGYVLNSDGAIFNRNQVGVYIHYFNPLATSYPFRVRNSVFTSRDLQTHNTNFPKQWPPTLGTGGLKNYWSPPDTFSAPLNIDNSSPGLGYSYPAISCYGGLTAQSGIFLDSVGTYTPDTSVHGGISVPASYAEITIGDTTRTDNNRNANLFSAIQFGIYAMNSDLTSVNNIYADMVANYLMTLHSLTPGGDGIFAYTTDDLPNRNRLRVYTPDRSGYQNKFYGFRMGVECSNYFDVIGRNCYLINKSFGSATYGAYGVGGFSIKTAKYGTLDISADTITNVNNGISVWVTYDPTYYVMSSSTTLVTTIPSQYVGLCNMDSNLIQARPEWDSAVTGLQHVSTAISYQNPTIALSTLPIAHVVDYVNNLNIEKNVIHDAYNGIYVNHFAQRKLHQPFTNDNTIYLRRDTTSRHARFQYGINHTSCFNSNVYYNTISGTDTTAAHTDDSMKAYYGASNTGMDIGCNDEFCVGRGYEFFMSNLGTNWHGNHMRANRKGFVLNGGVIGPQTNGGTVAHSNSINDKWLGAWTGLDSQTYVKSAFVSSSPLYVGLGTTTLPTINGAELFVLRYFPGSGIDTAYHLLDDCFPVLSPPYDTSSLYDLIAEQHVDFVYNVVSNNWMGQYALWKATVLDSSIVDSSAVVAQFAHMADSVSRFRYITDIEYAINSGDYSTATSLLGLNIDSMANTASDSATQVKIADDTTADYIVENYQHFYTLYIKYVTATMDSTDSLNVLALAQLCPEQNGAVVFQARALYSNLFNDLSMFNDDSCLTIDTSYIASRQSNNHHPNQQTVAATQHYSLQPNPNDGNFILRQTSPDDTPVKAEIFNAVGISIYRDDLYFSGGTDKLHLINAPPGLYLLRLTDSKNRQFILKFVVQ